MLVLSALPSTILVVTNSVFVLIPLKAFNVAKLRLAEVMTEDERVELAKKMAEIVIEAAKPLPVAIVCDDEDVAAWALTQETKVIWADRPGLNNAVQIGVNTLTEQGVEKIIIAHGDLPKAIRLSHCADFNGITFVPDRHKDGTPVLVIPTGLDFNFFYGPDSYALHIAEAERLSVPWRSLFDLELSHDVDEPEDLDGINF